MSTAESARQTILFADDEEALVMLFSAYLRRAGYMVKTASDGQRAYDLFLADPQGIALLITDVHMPTLSGLELAAKVSAAGCPVLMLSGTDAPAEASFHGWQFLCKPFSASVLLDKVRTMLDSSGNSTEAAAKG